VPVFSYTCYSLEFQLTLGSGPLKKELSAPAVTATSDVVTLSSVRVSAHATQHEIL